MSAESELLKSTLDKLHEQLAQVETSDPALRDQLKAALREIQSALENKQPPKNEPLMRRLGEAARHFDESHPAVASTIGSLINTLANSGI